MGKPFVRSTMTDIRACLYYHCYACGEHGDVIDFTAKLYGLSLYDAAKKLAANLIEKYAAVLDIENLPEPPICLDSSEKIIVNKSKLIAVSIEKTDIA